MMLISPVGNDTIELTSEQVRNEAMEVVETKFDIEIKCPEASDSSV